MLSYNTVSLVINIFYKKVILPKILFKEVYVIAYPKTISPHENVGRIIILPLKLFLLFKN